MLADTLRQALAEQGAMVSLVEVQGVIAIAKTVAGQAPLIKSNLSQATIPQARSRSGLLPQLLFHTLEWKCISHHASFRQHGS
jgi:hypothetical protein